MEDSFLLKYRMFVCYMDIITEFMFGIQEAVAYTLFFYPKMQDKGAVLANKIPVCF